MTKQNFLKYYNKLSGADKTLVFFQKNGKIYLWECDHVAPRWIQEGFESSSKGGQQKFRMYIKASEKEKLIKKGAIEVMTTEEFESIPYSNKGMKCEKWLHDKTNQDYKPNNKRFDKGGDICINGVEYQIKFENATLTNVDVLHKAQKAVPRKKRVTAADVIASWLKY